jgi:hypothetical protein
MSATALARYAAELESIRAQGLFKTERVIAGPQSAEIEPTGGACSTSAPTTTWASPTTRR